MTSASDKVPCIQCEKEKGVVKCCGCLQAYCYNHFEEHRQKLKGKLDELTVSRDYLQQTLLEKKKTLEKHVLIKNLEEWERRSIEKIRQTAEETKQSLLKSLDRYFIETERKLNQLTVQLRKSNDENDFFESDLQQWQEKLNQLKEKISRSSTDIILRQSTPLVYQIDIDTTPQLFIPDIDINAKWIQNGLSFAGNHGSGSDLGKLSFPHGLCIDYDQTMYIADNRNHRIIEWKPGKTSGQVIAGGSGSGSGMSQLNNPISVLVDKKNEALIICDRTNRRVLRWPRKNDANVEILISNIDCYGLAMDNNGYLYVCDHSKHEVRRRKLICATEEVVAGGNENGNRLDQLDSPTFIFVDRDESVYVSDSANHRVVKWAVGAKEGVVVAGGHGRGSRLTQLSNPAGVVVDQSGTVYVADYKNDRIMRWIKDATTGTIIVGGNGMGSVVNKFNGPWGLAFDQQNSLYVTDYWNHRVQKFLSINN